jgi:hypothetical protein
MSTESGKQSLLALDEAAAVVEPAFARAFPDAPASERAGRARQWLLFECEGSGVVEEVAGGRLRFWHLTFQEFLAALELARMERGQWWEILSQHLERAAWRETSELFVTCLYDLGQPARIDWFLEQVLERGPVSHHVRTRDLGARARTVGTIGRLLLPLRRCGYQSRQGRMRIATGFNPWSGRRATD